MIDAETKATSVICISCFLVRPAGLILAHNANMVSDYVKLRPGSVILAHNANMVTDYVKLVTSDPNLRPRFIWKVQLAVTLKKR